MWFSAQQSLGKKKEFSSYVWRAQKFTKDEDLAQGVMSAKKKKNQHTQGPF